MKKLWSIFTDDLNKCYITGMTVDLERHHVFEGRQGFKDKSEKYGFIVPLHASVHPNGARCSSTNWADLDHWLKRKCQEYFVEVAKLGSKEEWYNLFGRFYDDRADENVWLNEKWEWKI